MFRDNKRISISDTLIGQGTIVEGRLICEAKLSIEGEYRGDIESKEDVIIGESGIVRSSIHAKDVSISGIVYGDVSAHGRLIITATGQLHGNAITKALIIQDGGVFNGSCRMESNTPVASEMKSRIVQEHNNNNADTVTKETSNKEKTRQAV